MSKMTYGDLDKFLRSLGFAVRIANDGKARVYEHEEAGARISLPKLPSNQKVSPRHLMVVHITLNSYGIEEPLEFAAIVPRAN
jgi:hypothetical protein